MIFLFTKSRLQFPAMSHTVMIHGAECDDYCRAELQNNRPRTCIRLSVWTLNCDRPWLILSELSPSVIRICRLLTSHAKRQLHEPVFTMLEWTVAPPCGVRMMYRLLSPLMEGKAPAADLHGKVPFTNGKSAHANAFFK